ncbi:DNA helicase, partial [Tanacetum coccineum]
MRLSHENLQEAEKEKISTFVQWLLDIGNGHIGTPDEVDPENTLWIDIPDNYCIPDDENGISNLTKFIYDDKTLHNPTDVELQERAVVCPKNDTTYIINAKVVSMLSGRVRTYINFDDTLPHGHHGGEVELLYPKEYLNTLSFAGLPLHRLELKIGIPIMLLHNVNIVDGLYNGTRLIVKQLLPRVIEAQIITYTRVSQQKNLPRIPLTMKDIEFRLSLRVQFPIKSIELHEISNVGFPEHYFNFAAYNELPTRANVENATGLVYHDLYLGEKALVERENVGFDLTKSDLCPCFVEVHTTKYVGLLMADSHTGNHREDNFMPLETIRRFLGKEVVPLLEASTGLSNVHSDLGPFENVFDLADGDIIGGKNV